MEPWNANLCTDENIGKLVFESYDSDKETRLLQPVWVQNEEMGFNNKLNAFSNTGVWVLERLQRFPSLVWLKANGYNIEFTGMNPKNLHFELYAPSATPGILLTIRYPFA